MHGGNSISARSHQAYRTNPAPGHGHLLNLPPLAAWMLPRGLATLGAVLFAAGALLPWFSLAMRFGPGSPVFHTQVGGAAGPSYLFSLLRLISGPSRIAEALVWAWWAVFIAGLLLCPVLWQRLSGRAARISSLFFTGWVTVATIFSTVSANAILRQLSGLAYEPVDYNVTIVQHDPQWGLAFTVLGLSLSWTAAALLRHEPVPSVARQVSPHVPLQPLASGVTSIGVAVWALGFIALPWATVNCNSIILSLNHYVNGSCGALDAGDALAYSDFGRALPLSDLNGTIPTLIYAVLAGGALLVLLAGWWRRGLSRELCAWMTAWFVPSLAAALYALRGVPIILRVHPQLGSETAGTWIVGQGVLVTFFGLLLAAVGLAALWLLALRYPNSATTGK